MCRIRIRGIRPRIRMQQVSNVLTGWAAASCLVRELVVHKAATQAGHAAGQQSAVLHVVSAVTPPPLLAHVHHLLSCRLGGVVASARWGRVTAGRGVSRSRRGSVPRVSSRRRCIPCWRRLPVSALGWGVGCARGWRGTRISLLLVRGRGSRRHLLVTHCSK